MKIIYNASTLPFLFTGISINNITTPDSSSEEVSICSYENGIPHSLDNKPAITRISNVSNIYSEKTYDYLFRSFHHREKGAANIKITKRSCLDSVPIGKNEYTTTVVSCSRYILDTLHWTKGPAQVYFEKQNNKLAYFRLKWFLYNCLILDSCGVLPSIPSSIEEAYKLTKESIGFIHSKTQFEKSLMSDPKETEEEGDSVFVLGDEPISILLPPFPKPFLFKKVLIEHGVGYALWFQYPLSKQM
jgi:hypothetical protein